MDGHIGKPIHIPELMAALAMASARADENTVTEALRSA